MTDWLTRFENARSTREARKSLPQLLTNVHGRDYFERVRSLVASDPARARSLAGRWSLLAVHPLTKPWAFRTKGVLERLAGHWSESVKSFDLAASSATESADKLVFGIGAIDSLGRIGRVSEAVRRATKISKGLVPLGMKSEAGMAELNAANALLWHDRYAPAKVRYERALTLLNPDVDESLVAATKLGLSTLELFGGHPNVATRRAQEAEDTFSKLEQSDFALLAKKNRAQALQLLGRADEAVGLLLEIRTAFQVDSLEFGRTEEFLGDAYMRLNLWREATDAYTSALTIPSFRRSPMNQANAWLGLGIANLEMGQFRVAEPYLRRALATFRRFGNRVWEGVALTKLAQLAKLRGEYRSARKLSSKARLAFDSKAPALLVEAVLEHAEAGLALGYDPKSDLNLAKRCVQKSGAIQLEWRIHHIRALSARRGKALPHFRRMAASIFDSRALVVSTSARASYYLGKAAALSQYVQHLLSKPTRLRTEEALAVIRSTRSVALLEEILAATSPRSEEIQTKLQTLREELNLATQDTPTSSTTRRSLSKTRSLTSLQRNWVELMNDARSEIQQPQGQTSWPDVVFIEAPDRILSLSNGKVSTAGWTPDDLKAKLSWLRFELLAPMTDRETSPEPTLSLLGEFADVFSLAAKPATICPEGLLWQVPWQVLSSLANKGEAVMTVGPWSGRAQQALPPEPSAMVWFDPLSDLPHVEREAQTFLKRFPDARVCTTVAEVRRALTDGRVDLLHVASHARFNSASPLFSTLTFSGERITAGEIARTGLRTRQVVLSACETGTVSLQNRMEPEGLVRAFLARGAESVLASTWPLDDESACDFMDTFYVELLRGCSVAEATATSRHALRQQRPHPYFWGSFTLFGGYTS